MNNKKIYQFVKLESLRIFSIESYEKKKLDFVKLD